MFKPLAIASMMRDYGISPKKGLGQNFLIDENHLTKIAEIAGIDKHTDVLEIGAGLGNLTRHLAVAGRRITAVEIDNQLIPILKKLPENSRMSKLLRGIFLRFLFPT